MADTRPTNERSTSETTQDSAQFLTVRGELIIRENEYAAPSVTSDRIEAEFARIQKFGDDAFNDFSAILGADNPTDISRKLYRFVLASLNPGPVLGRVFEQSDPGEFEAFCLRLSAYREFLSLVEQGKPSRHAADLVAEQQRRRIQHQIEPRSEVPTDEGVWMQVDADVYGADDEIDLGAVRAEIDRLLAHLNVDRARIRVSLVPDDGVDE